LVREYLLGIEKGKKQWKVKYWNNLGRMPDPATLPNISTWRKNPKVSKI